MCTYTWKYFVPSRLEVTGTLARRLFKKSCVCDINKLQAARGISFEIIVISWTRSFTVRVTHSGQKSRDHSIPSLGTEKIMLLSSTLKVYKMRSKLNFWLTASTNGESTRLCHKLNDFCRLFWLLLGCAWLWLAEEFHQKWRWLLFIVVVTHFFAKQCVLLPPNKIIVNFWSLRDYSKRDSRLFTFYSRRN